MANLTMTFYLRTLKSRYFKAKRKAKGVILDEFCETSGLTRKHVIRMLHRRPIGWRERPAGRRKSYKAIELLNPLKQIWLATDQMCGERLKSAMPLWLPYYEKEYGVLEPEIK